MRILCFLTLLALTASAAAHDTWVQPNTTLIRVGDAAYIDLLLGNHGNEHREYKLASKITLAPCTLCVLGPDGRSTDLKPSVIDLGSAEKEGYWSTRFVADKPGLHTVVHTLDTLHRTTRAVKSGKTYFLAAEKLDAPSATGDSYAQPLGLPIELVPLTNPLAAAPGKPLKLAVYRHGKPFAGARVSFIPRGVTLKEGFDSDYERTSNAAGVVEFTPPAGNYYLIVVHHLEPEEKGEGYERTHYSATLTLLVPERAVLAQP